jgi:hypothetical protein
MKSKYNAETDSMENETRAEDLFQHQSYGTNYNTSPREETFIFTRNIARLNSWNSCSISHVNPTAVPPSQLPYPHGTSCAETYLLLVYDKTADKNCVVRMATDH